MDTCIVVSATERKAPRNPPVAGATAIEGRSSTMTEPVYQHDAERGREREWLLDMIGCALVAEDGAVEAVVAVGVGYVVRRYYLERPDCPVKLLAHFHDAIHLRRYWWHRTRRIITMSRLRAPESEIEWSL
jgi:hypothetical protein